MSVQYFEERKTFYQNVFLPFYCNIVCKNIVCDVALRVPYLVFVRIQDRYRAVGISGMVLISKLT